MIYVAYYQPEPEQTQMASRTAHKSAIEKNSTAVVSYVRELPGAVFYGDIADEDIDYAERLQRIRSEYENDDCQMMLWHDLSQMGFDPSEIREFVANPAAITNCGYYSANALR
jgi:hypothetical protein